MPSVRISLPKKLQFNSASNGKALPRSLGGLKEIANPTVAGQQPQQQQQYFGSGLTEADTNSLNELIRFEPAERPPSLGQLKEFTSHRFSEKWIKYMYAKFKNECPAGRMKLGEFKLLFGPYVPDRMSDAYLERMFNAFCCSSAYADQLTFKDLIECLSTLCDEDAHTNAEWTMRLINGQKSDHITLPEFNEFVKSVFLLVGQGEQRRKRMDSIFPSGETKLPPIPVSPIPVLPPPPTIVVDKETLKAVRKRAAAVFKELDVDGQGYFLV